MGVSYNDDGCCRWGNHSPVSLRPFRGWHLLLNNKGKGLWDNSNHSIGVRRTLDYPRLKADMGRKQDDANWKRIKTLFVIVGVGAAVLALMI